MSNPLADMEKPDVIFCIGTNMTECHPVAATRLKKAIARGAKMIVADPRRIGLAELAERDPTNPWYDYWRGRYLTDLGDEAAASRMDDLLWTFRDGSFVPHGLAGRHDGTETSPIMIGCDATGMETRDLLINLCDEIPAFAEGFTQSAECVTSDENCRKASRKRYAAYRDQGHELNTHNL